MSKKHKVFVYGTLKKNFPNSRLLKDAEFRGEAKTLKKFRMYTNGYFPMIVPDSEHGTFISGEVYSVDEHELARLDMLEGCPEMYYRSAVSVEDADGYRHTAYVYIWGRPVGDLDEVASGVWEGKRS